MKRALIITPLLLAACQPISPTINKQEIANKFADAESEQYHPQDNVVHKMTIAQAKQSVRNTLNDPNSAQFRGVFVTKSHDPSIQGMVGCGEVNAKNAFGGYAGYQHFVAIDNGAITYSERDDGYALMLHELPKWKQICG